jgi:repressor LexA
MGRTRAGETREKVYRFVRRRLHEGRPPTVREVRDRFGFRAVQTAREHLEKLVAAGRLRKEPGRARGYRLPGTAPATVLVPVLGRVPAGPLDLAVEDLEGYVAVEGAGSEDGELFGLRVRGESMRDAGILPGDLVIVRKQDTARSGEIVVALVGEEATVKTLRRAGRRVELHPANPDFSPIVPASGELRVLGRVIEVRRRLA